MARQKIGYNFRHVDSPGSCKTVVTVGPPEEGAEFVRLKTAHSDNSPSERGADMSKYKSAGDLIKALEDGRLHEEAAFVGTLKRQVGSHAQRIGQLHEQVIGLTNENMQLRARHGLAQRPGRTGGAATSFDREFEVPATPRQQHETDQQFANADEAGWEGHLTQQQCADLADAQAVRGRATERLTRMTEPAWVQARDSFVASLPKEDREVLVRLYDAEVRLLSAVLTGEAVQAEGQPLECAECGGGIWYMEKVWESARLVRADVDSPIDEVLERHEPLDVDDTSDSQLICGEDGSHDCGWELVWDDEHKRTFARPATG